MDFRYLFQLFHSALNLSKFSINEYELISGKSDGIPIELFQILKDDAMKVLHSICRVLKFGRLSSGHRTGKGQFSFQSQRKAKECSNYHTIALIPQASNPLQCSCLENPRNGGAWWAAIYGVTQSRTQLKRLSSSSSSYLVGHEGDEKQYDLPAPQILGSNAPHNCFPFLCP